MIIFIYFYDDIAYVMIRISYNAKVMMFIHKMKHYQPIWECFIVVIKMRIVLLLDSVVIIVENFFVCSLVVDACTKQYHESTSPSTYDHDFSPSQTYSHSIAVHNSSPMPTYPPPHVQLSTNYLTYLKHY